MSDKYRKPTTNYFLSPLPQPVSVVEDAPRRFVTARDLAELVALG